MGRLIAPSPQAPWLTRVQWRDLWYSYHVEDFVNLLQMKSSIILSWKTSPKYLFCSVISSFLVTFSSVEQSWVCFLPLCDEFFTTTYGNSWQICYTFFFWNWLPAWQWFVFGPRETLRSLNKLFQWRQIQWQFIPSVRLCYFDLADQHRYLKIPTDYLQLQLFSSQSSLRRSRSGQQIMFITDSKFNFQRPKNWTKILVELICIFRKVRYSEDEGLSSTFIQLKSFCSATGEKCVPFKASTSHVHQCQQNMA